jgi:signal transduction histidine kinase
LPTWTETVPSGLFLLDDELNVIATNRAASELLRRSRTDMLGVTLIRATRDHNLVEVAREAAGVAREVNLRDHQVVHATATRLLDSFSGVRVILALEDRTELRHAQRARSDLVANASHELRTPVAAAMALAETLEDGVEDEARRIDFHHRLTEEIGRLNGIIEGLLHLSRLEARTEAFAIEPLVPRELLVTALQRIEPLLTSSQVSASELQSETPVAGDRERILEVLANLLDNALRVTPPSGNVILSAIDGEGEVRFEVRDQGPGILHHDRERIFERFYTGDVSRTASGNSGLGLAIARHIIARLGGRIWVDERTPGATLCFTLPVSEEGVVDGEVVDDELASLSAR